MPDLETASRKSLAEEIFLRLTSWITSPTWRPAWAAFPDGSRLRTTAPDFTSRPISAPESSDRSVASIPRTVTSSPDGDGHGARAAILLFAFCDFDLLGLVAIAEHVEFDGGAGSTSATRFIKSFASDLLPWSCRTTSPRWRPAFSAGLRAPRRRSMPLCDP